MINYIIEHFQAGFKVDASWIVLYFIINAVIGAFDINNKAEPRFQLHLLSFFIMLIIMLISSYYYNI